MVGTRTGAGERVCVYSIGYAWHLKNQGTIFGIFNFLENIIQFILYNLFFYTVY
jgi:hypothetical protein